MPIRAKNFVGRGGGIRTHDPLLPKADALTGLRYAPTEDLNYTDPFKPGQHLLCFIFSFFDYLIIFNRYLFLYFTIRATLLCQVV